MFVQGKESDKCGEILNLAKSSDEQVLLTYSRNNSIDEFNFKPNLDLDNDEQGQCVESEGDVEIKSNLHDVNIFKIVQTEDASGDKFLVQDVLDASDSVGIANRSEPLQCDAMGLENPSITRDSTGLEVKSHDLEKILVNEFEAQLEKDHESKSAERESSFQAQGLGTTEMQLVPSLDTSSYLMVQTSDGEQVYTLDTSQFLQAVNSEEHIPLGENAQVVLGLMNTTDDLNQAEIVMGNQNDFVIKTLPIECNEVCNEKKSSKKVQNQIRLKCPEENCDKTFDSKSKLKAHSAVHCQQERLFKCTVESCEWSFSSSSKLNRHLESHNGLKKFTCDEEGCNKNFTTVYNLKAHKKIHDRPFIVPCTVCDEKFPSRRLMEIHLKDHKDIDAPHKCPVENCDKRFYSSYALASHQRKHQTHESDLRCSFKGCNKLFENQSRLKQHFRQHSGERPYVCDFSGCKWAFTTGSKLARHKRKHTGVRKYVCPNEDCDKKFMRKEHLDQHVISHSKERPFVCEYKGCNSRFAAKASWYVHRRKVHLSKPSKMSVFVCVLKGCQKEFESKELMTAHLQEHLGQNLNAASIDSGLVALLSGNEISETELENSLSMAAATSSDINGAIVTLAGGDASCKEMCSTTSSGQTIHIFPVKCSESNELTQAVNAIDNVPSTPLDNEVMQIDVDSILPSEKFISSTRRENCSGSARTDYVFEYSSERKKYQHPLRNIPYDVKEKSLSPEEESVSRKRTFSEIDDSHASLAMNLAPTDVVLTSGAITFRDPTTGTHFVQTQLLQDDPPCVITDVQSDQLLPNLCSSQLSQSSELTVPVSLLSENADSSSKSQVPQFFNGMTLSLQDFPNDSGLQHGDC